MRANDAAQAEQFTAGFTLRPMRDILAYRELVSPVDTTFEAEQISKRKVVERELDTLMTAFRKCISAPRGAEELYEACQLQEEDRHRGEDSPIAMP